MGCNEHEEVNGVSLAIEASLKDIGVNLPRLVMIGSAVFDVQIFSRATSGSDNEAYLQQQILVFGYRYLPWLFR